MKKLLTLVLVLGLTSLANAGLIFTVNGQPQPDEITLFPSEAVELDLEIGEGQTILGYDLTYRLSNGQAEFLIDGYTDDFGNTFGAIEFPLDFDFRGYVVDASPQSVWITGTQFLSDDLVGPGTIMQGLVLHSLDTTPVLLEVIVSGTTIVDGEEFPLEPSFTRWA